MVFKISNNMSSASPTPVIDDTYPISYIVALACLGVFIFLVNVVVIYLFATRTVLRKETNRILVSLAFSDIVNGIVSIPLQISCNVNAQNERSVRLASMVLYRFVAASTMFHILAVTLERHICVAFPLRYTTLVTRRRTTMAVCAIWITSAFYAVVGLSWLGLADEYNHRNQPPGLNNSKIMRIEFAYTIIGFFLCFFAPLTIMLYSFTKILSEISRHNRRESELTSGMDLESSQGRTRMLLDRKPVIIFIVMLMVFVFSWSSWYVQLFVLVLAPQSYKPLGGAFDFLRYATSLINPLLYSLFKKDFRKALKPFLANIKTHVPNRRKSVTSDKTQRDTVNSLNTNDNV